MVGEHRYCPYCGSYIEDNPKFCPNCGARMPETPSMGAAAYNQPYENSQQQYGNPQQPYGNYQQPYGSYNMYGRPPQMSTGGLTAIGIISIILAVISLITGVILVIFSDSSDFGSGTDALLIQGAVALVGIAIIVLGLAGLIGGICAVGRKHYGLGLAMFIIALIICAVDFLMNFSLVTIVATAIAIVFLIVYVKHKQCFTR